MGIITDSELRYRIRGNLQILSEQADIIQELCDEINTCLNNPSEHYNKISETCNLLCEVANKNKQLIEEVRNHMLKIREERMSH